MAPKRKRPPSTGKDDTSRGQGEAEQRSNFLEKNMNKETLGNISRGSVGKLLTRVKRRDSKGFNVEECSYLQPCNSSEKLNGSFKPCDDTTLGRDTINAASFRGDDATQDICLEEAERRKVMLADSDGEDGQDDTEWEDGSVSMSSSGKNIGEGLVKGVTVEFDVLPTPAKRKVVRRATAEEREMAELIHKAHLLSLIGRGRIIDRACDDPLIQASLLSVIPMHLLKITEVPQLTAKALTPLVSWLHSNFRIRSTSSTEILFHSALASALETREGSAEEVAALSVALFRALKLTARFVSILDVVPLKPDADHSESPGQASSEKGSRIFKSSTLMVPGSSHAHALPTDSPLSGDEESSRGTSLKNGITTRAQKSLNDSIQPTYPSIADKSEVVMNQTASVVDQNALDPCFAKKTEELKRKGDLEFELQLEMAISATAVGNNQNNTNCNEGASSSTSNFLSRLKRIKNTSTGNGISTAIGSKKVGAPLFWAEVYCSGENLTGKWVHVDVVNAIIDGEQQVEAAAAACKKSLRYVVAFAGQGAKDVTRRYCAKWYKIASQRINSNWWDEVLAPLKQLESAGYTIREDADSTRNSAAASRSSLEDMELETRALTEPLPTNQQAYKNHPLYAIERWLSKYQVLYPKGPVLGLCSGHPVYPRTSVQTLHTKERWMREGLQVKADEPPAKVLSRSQKHSIVQDGEDDDECIEGRHGETTDLYGKWQTEPLNLPRAVDGVVPKNERGQVDVWSEKCLPLGTVHLRLPRVAAIAKRLGIDYAPAMVGFEFRSGRYLPIYDGIVVCVEFKDVMVEAYAEEEERRVAEEKRRNEAQALSRWYQLLSSIVTRQRLKNCYGVGATSETLMDMSNVTDSTSTPATKSEKAGKPARCKKNNTQDKQPKATSFELTDDHEHEFFLEDQGLDEEGSTQIKRCRCGFSLEIEEL